MGIRGVRTRRFWGIEGGGGGRKREQQTPVGRKVDDDVGAKERRIERLFSPVGWIGARGPRGHG